MRIVLDTNVVVSGLMSDATVPAQVLDLCIAGDVDLIVDARILNEYREVLGRRELGLDPTEVAAFLELTRYAEHVVALPLKLTLPDADDLPFVEVAAAAGADAIVSGNAKHFLTVRGKIDVAVLTPRELLARLSAE